MSIAFVVLKLEVGQIDPPPGVKGSRSSPVGICLTMKTSLHLKYQTTECNMVSAGIISYLSMAFAASIIL